MTESLRSFGWDDGWAAAFEEAPHSEALPGRVAAQHRNRWTVLTEDGPRPARLPGAAPSDLRPVTGDWVGCTPGPEPDDPLTLRFVLPRKTAYERRRVDPRARAEHLAQFKTAFKTLRYHPKHQDRD